MTDPKESGKPKISTREPKKKTQGIFDNLRPLNQPHPVEEILGLTQSPALEESRTPPTPPTARTARTPPTPRRAGTPRTPPTSIAPERDYSKVANSIVREAVAGGHFTGKSKQLYDFLYSRTRGAIVPMRSVRITKPRLMKGSSIGSERTLLKNIGHLKSIGLLQVIVTDGEHGGNEYIVYLPEEVNAPDERTPRTPPTPPTAATDSRGRHAPQEVGGVPTLESGVGGVGLSLIESEVSSEPKTFSKDVQRTTDDDDAALAQMVTTLKAAAKDVTGKEPSSSEQDRWREVGEVIATEFRIAAARTTVSSAPSFLAEHLRRRLFKKDKSQLQAEQPTSAAEVLSAPHLSPSEIAHCPDCGGSGMYYPEGYDKGVAKCRHARLQLEATPASEQK